MGGWGRRLGAIVAALAVSIVVISIVQAVSGWMYPPPPGLDLTDREALRAFAEQLPIGALLMVELSYLLGSLTGGVTAGIIGRDSVYRLGAVVGGLLTLAGFANLAAIPHPLWFVVLSTLTYVPCAYAGVWIVERWRRSRTS